MKDVTLDFVLDVLKTTGDYDIGGMIFWRTDEDYAPLTFFAICNDVFAWACADAEEITPQNLPDLKKALKDVEISNHCCNYIEGVALFVSRIRKERPQGACYPEDKTLWKLFDETGPEREIDISNPFKPGEYQEKYKKGDSK